MLQTVDCFAFEESWTYLWTNKPDLEVQARFCTATATAAACAAMGWAATTVSKNVSACRQLHLFQSVQNMMLCFGSSLPHQSAVVLCSQFIQGRLAGSPPFTWP